LTVTPHPDHEQLSAHLDGESTADVGTHVDGCPTCQARLAELQSVSRAVAEPVVPPSGARDQAVAAALDALREGSRLGEEPWVWAPGGPTNVLPLRRRPRVPTWAVAAAAVVAGLLVTGTVVATLGGDGGGDQTAMAPPRAESFAAPGSGPVRQGGDLGDQSDARALAEVVRAGLGSTGAAAPAGAEAPSAASERAGQQAADTARTATADPPCAREARDLLPGLGPLVYTSTLRWQGTPAVALAFLASHSTGPGPLAHQVMVMAPQEACRLLVVQRF
jgi:hypothetical protein